MIQPNRFQGAEILLFVDNHLKFALQAFEKIHFILRQNYCFHSTLPLIIRINESTSTTCWISNKPSLGQIHLVRAKICSFKDNHLNFVLQASKIIFGVSAAIGSLVSKCENMMAGEKNNTKYRSINVAVDFHKPYDYSYYSWEKKRGSQ